jgi:hypothetical protein
MARKRRLDAGKLKLELDALTGRIAELEERRLNLLKEREEAEKAEIVEIVLGAGLNADALRVVVAAYAANFKVSDGDAETAADSGEGEKAENPPGESYEENHKEESA